jgi:hypothetical protein
MEMEAVEEGEAEEIFYDNILAEENEEKEQDGEQKEERSMQDCVCRGRVSSTEDKEESCTKRDVSVRKRLKSKRPESKEAKWESIRRNAWLRELLSSSSEEEEEQGVKRARMEGESCSRFEESARWMAEAEATGWARLVRQPAKTDPAKKTEPRTRTRYWMK